MEKSTTLPWGYTVVSETDGVQLANIVHPNTF